MEIFFLMLLPLFALVGSGGGDDDGDSGEKNASARNDLSDDADGADTTDAMEDFSGVSGGEDDDLSAGFIGKDALVDDDGDGDGKFSAFDGDTHESQQDQPFDGFQRDTFAGNDGDDLNVSTFGIGEASINDAPVEIPDFQGASETLTLQLDPELKSQFSAADLISTVDPQSGDVSIRLAEHLIAILRNPADFNIASVSVG